MKKIFLMILPLTFLVSCNNDDDSSINSTIDHPISYVELTNNNNQLDYTLVALTSDEPIDYNNKGIKSTNVFSQLDECELDDLFIFSYSKSINQYVWLMDENKKSCDDNPPYYIKNEGAFKPDPTQKTIEFYDDEKELVFKATNVKLIEENKADIGITFTLTFDFYDPYFKTTLHYKYVKKY